MTTSFVRRIRSAAALPLLLLTGLATPASAGAAGPAPAGSQRAAATQVLPAGDVVNARDFPVTHPATGTRRQPPHLSRVAKSAGSTGSAPTAAPGPVSSNATLNTSFIGASLDGDISCCGGVNAQGVEPPDTVVAAGTSDIVEAVNSVMQITNKSGTVLDQVDLNSFFSFPNSTYSFTDPRVEWDAADGRWFLTGFGFDNNNDSDMKILTSTTSDPTGGWVRTDVVQKTNVIADQPKLGFDGTVAVMAWDDYNGTTLNFIGNQTYVLQKSDLINGVTVHVAHFADDPNEFSVVPARSYDGGTTAFAAENDSCGRSSVGTCSTSSSNFELISITGTPANANVARSFTHLAMNATVVPPDADQPGTNGTASLDTNDDRFLSDNLAGGIMYVTGNDVCVPSGDSHNRPCTRLMEVNVSGTPVLSVNTDIGIAGNDVYFAAAVPDTSGNVALSATESSTTMFPSSVVLSAITGSTSFTSLTVKSGTVEYDSGSSCLNAANPQNRCRWGDYAGAAIDPSTPDDLWLASEWGGTGTDFGWSTEVYEVSFPASMLAVSAPASTTSVQQFFFTVTAQLANGATATGYTGTVTFTSSDSSAVLPPNYTFLPSDHGSHTFSASLSTRGSQTLTATDTVSAITGFATIIVGPPPVSLSSPRQYSLSASDGSTWQPMDLANLRTVVTPPSSETAVITANADLWTAVAGYNQDLGIQVTPQCGNASSSLVAWKESGGFAGTFSPNAAAVQGSCDMTGGTSYTIEVVWKANVANGAGGRATPSLIFAGAGGPSVFSPTTVTAFFVGAGGLNAASSNSQYHLSSSQNPTTWQPVDTTNLREQVTVGSTTTMYLSANADLWTGTPQVNQDLGILVTPACNGDSGPSTLVWKESGGFAGTFSPNAAFAQDMCSMTGGTQYTLTLEWKSNVAIPAGGAIFMAAGGSAPYSPTTLYARPLAGSPAPQPALITQQKQMSGSDGTTWQPVDDPALTLSVGGTNNCAVTLTGNADLWTANATYNQDLGLQITPPSGPAYILAWKESGGFAGTFSPNAAFVQGVLETTSASHYTVTLVWKANRSMPNADTIFIGAGQSPTFSPTTLEAQTAC